eukprot:s115_g16.t1
MGWDTHPKDPIRILLFEESQAQSSNVTHAAGTSAELQSVVPHGPGEPATKSSLFCKASEHVLLPAAGLESETQCLRSGTKQFATWESQVQEVVFRQSGSDGEPGLDFIERFKGSAGQGSWERACEEARMLPTSPSARRLGLRRFPPARRRSESQEVFVHSEGLEPPRVECGRVESEFQGMFKDMAGKPSWVSPWFLGVTGCPMLNRARICRAATIPAMPSNGTLPKDAQSHLKSDAAAANVLVQCLLGQGSLQLEGWKPSKAVTDAIALLAEEARQQLPDVALGLWPGASEQEPYDEMRETKGRCRPAYVGVVAQIEQILKQKPKRINDFKEESEKCFKGDNRLYHIPRMLTRHEADKVIAGVAQRAQALRRLVMDVNSRKEMKVGQLSCVKCGALPREVFSRIAARAGEQWTQNLVQKEGESKKLYWNMWYGPDIIRGPSENGHDFYVVEDNLGYVGGFGDLPLARSVLLGEASGSKGFPEFKPFLELENAERLYEEMAAHYKRNVAEGEKVVVLYYHRSVRDDNEDRRLVTLLRQKGLVPVQLPDENGPREDQPRLVVRHGRVFLVERKPVAGNAGNGPAATGNAAPRHDRSRSPRRSPRRPASPARTAKTATAETSDPVGLVVLLSEPTDVQPGHASTKLRSAIDEARQRIEAYEEMETKEKMKAARNEKSLVSVKSKVDFLDTEGNKSSLQMKGGKLIWTWTEKGTNQSDTWHFSAPKGKEVPRDADSSSENESYSDVGDDALVYQESDMEVESEDDTWFDQMIASSLSSSSITPTEPEDGVPVRSEDQPAICVPDDSQVALTELDSPTSKCDIPPETPKTLPDRPVARPLAGIDNGKGIIIEDSPDVKKELLSVADDPGKTMREKEAHLRLLRGRLVALEKQLEFQP